MATGHPLTRREKQELHNTPSTQTYVKARKSREMSRTHLAIMLRYKHSISYFFKCMLKVCPFCYINLVNIQSTLYYIQKNHTNSRTFCIFQFLDLMRMYAEAGAIVVLRRYRRTSHPWRDTTLCR